MYSHTLERDQTVKETRLCRKSSNFSFKKKIELNQHNLYKKTNTICNVLFHIQFKRINNLQDIFTFVSRSKISIFMSPHLFSNHSKTYLRRYTDINYCFGVQETASFFNIKNHKTKKKKKNWKPQSRALLYKIIQHFNQTKYIILYAAAWIIHDTLLHSVLFLFFYCNKAYKYVSMRSMIRQKQSRFNLIGNKLQ